MRFNQIDVETQDFTVTDRDKRKIEAKLREITPDQAQSVRF